MNDLIIQGSRLELTPPLSMQPENFLQSAMNWPQTLRQTAYHGVLPLFFRNLKKHSDWIPDKAMEQMKSAYLANLARNTRLFHKLVPLLRAFDRVGLRAVLTRGGRLAQTVYKDWGLRHFADIDFMVHPQDVDLLVQVLRKQGYWENSYASKFPANSTHELSWIIETGFHKEGLLLDFHLNFPGIEMPLDTDPEIWDNLRTLDIFGQPTRIFPLEYELCLLCLHGQKHCYERLIWMTDIAELSSHPEIDWEEVIEICQRLEVSAQVYYGLYLVNMLWPRTVPVEVILKLDPGALQKKILSVIWPAEKVATRQLNTEQVGHASVLFLFFSFKRLGLKLRVLLSIAFPPRGYVHFFYKIPGNSFKIYFYYFWRMFRPFPILFKALLKI